MGSARKIQELANLLNNEKWKKFRRSEELVFVPIDKNSPFFPGIEQEDTTLIERMQWHCWMCITGTVRRSTDGHLIHCNIDTDMTIETQDTKIMQFQIICIESLRIFPHRRVDFILFLPEQAPIYQLELGQDGLLCHQIYC